MPAVLRRALAAAGVVPGATDLSDLSGLPLPITPPSTLARLAEVLTVREVGRLAVAGPRLARGPRGDGGPVIDIPGWLAPESSGAPLRAYLRALGHDARGWGHGTNRGDPQRDADLLGSKVVELAGRTGRPVALVGWSLGGVIAREVARQHPDAVSRVVTYGTPVVGGPSFTIGAASAGPAECRRITELIERTEAESPIRVPITAIFTRRDGIVAWQACIDRTSPDVEHIEVGSTHLGLGIDPDVWHVVARRLAAPVG